MAGQAFQFTPTGLVPLSFTEAHTPIVRPLRETVGIGLHSKRLVARGILLFIGSAILRLQRLSWWAQRIAGENDKSTRMRRWSKGAMERDCSEWLSRSRNGIR